MLELTGVSHHTGREMVLDRVSLRIAAGQPHVILAPAGPARSSLLRLMSGQEKPDKGAVKFGSQDPAKSRPADVMVIRKFGAEATGRKVRAMIHQAARRGGMPSRLADIEVTRAATAAGLSGHIERKVKELDLEARIRLQLAMAAAQKPRLLLVDDPLAGLEGEARARLLVDLAAMLSIGERVVIIYATASPVEARAIGGELVVIGGGLVAQSGPTVEVLDHPHDLATARATTYPALNILGVSCEGGVWRLGDGSTFAPPAGLPLPAEAGFSIAFRSEDATWTRADERALRFLVRGQGAETLGGIRYARVSFSGVDWRVASPAGGDPAPGVMLNLFVDRDRAMLFDANGVSIAPAPATRVAS
jgi:ABC-type sugar transport system ATPase subunit